MIYFCFRNKGGKMKSEVIGKRVRRLLEEKQTETSVIAKKLKISTRTLEDKLEGKKNFI